MKTALIAIVALVAIAAIVFLAYSFLQPQPAEEPGGGEPGAEIRIPYPITEPGEPSTTSTD